MIQNITISEILDDLRTADEITRRYERRFWLSSADFYTLYQQGMLDNGNNLEVFTLWAGFYEIKQEREVDLQTFASKKEVAFIIEYQTYNFSDLILASNSSLEFWDNPFDNED